MNGESGFQELLGLTYKTLTRSVLVLSAALLGVHTSLLAYKTLQARSFVNNEVTEDLVITALITVAMLVAMVYAIGIIQRYRRPHAVLVSALALLVTYALGVMIWQAQL